MRRRHFAGAQAVALALALTTGAGLASGQSSQIQLAFGYDCGDRFQVRNDGAQPVDVEYGAAGADRTRLHLNARESVAIASASDNPMELWVNNHRVSTEAKGDRACAPSGQDVVVRPLNSGDYSNDAPANNGSANGADNIAADAAPNAGNTVSYSIQPTRVVYGGEPAYYPYYGYNPYYFGAGYGYGSRYGYYGYRPPRISVVVPFRSTRVGRPGYGGGNSHGPGRPSGGHSGGRTAVRR
jgi:hypothetical protein